MCQTVAGSRKHSLPLSQAGLPHMPTVCTDSVLVLLLVTGHVTTLPCQPHLASTLLGVLCTEDDSISNGISDPPLTGHSHDPSCVVLVANIVCGSGFMGPLFHREYQHTESQAGLGTQRGMNSHICNYQARTLPSRRAWTGLHILLYSLYKENSDSTTTSQLGTPCRATRAPSCELPGATEPVET